MEIELKQNLKGLRKLNGYTLEAVAEKLGVSRQAVAKWEKGDSVPDIANCLALAELYDVTLDTLVRNAEKRGERTMIRPNGKHVFGMVRVNEKGQITIPARARKIFGLENGTMLLILGDEEQGIAMVKVESELPEDAFE
ncbi:MAG: helix-turn-helix domain-containing protein [Bacteroides sp.]|nr:helix-turn-helix domain-containing protein [Eubacterium sp.]MCM1417776.1 helix-turn-helix domain-containing protein [Roseburia sp.]MCM1461333.1 helix-turn-helix domain-containing protein [Bacteroides sp.]